MNKVSVIEISMEQANNRNFEELHTLLTEELEHYNNRGFEVVSITPITSGRVDYDSGNEYGHGYSYTSGYVVIFKQVAMNSEEEEE